MQKRFFRKLALIASPLLVNLACASSAAAPSNRDPLAAHEAWNVARIDTLRAFGRDDQSDRDVLAQALAARDSAALIHILRADSSRSLWLRRTIHERGWPGRASPNDGTIHAAWLILQHSPFHDWQRSMLPMLERLAGRGEVSRPDLALFTDRVLVQSGELQRYGSQFKVVEGRLEPEGIADLSHLDARRAAAGLPPMVEYVRMLGETYKLPVVWPPVR